MEQSKVKTLKDINIYAYQYASDNWSEEYRKISAHSYAAGYVKAQSHITKLEARVKELEEALKSCVNFLEELSELKIAQNWSGLDHIKGLISKEA